MAADEPSILVMKCASVLIQDGGRFGYASLGVACSGFFDRTSATLANASVGNTVDAPCLELAAGSVELKFLSSTRVCVGGAARDVWLSSGARRSQGMWIGFDVGAGQLLRLGGLVDGHGRGLRSYLAISGGITALCRRDETMTACLGSMSYDTLSALGPGPVRSGDVLKLGPSAGWPVSRSHGEAPVVGIAPPHLRDGWVRLKIFRGQSHASFSSHFARSPRLGSGLFRVLENSNRIGVRLGCERELIEMTALADRASVPTLPGFVQMPSSRELIVLGPDSPVTGGYPVVGALDQQSLNRLAQLRPGDRLELGWA